MGGEIRRESFADEASWLEFQHNQLELAKHKRQRELAQQHAQAGRDYGIAKLLRQRASMRAASLKWQRRNPERVAAQKRARWDRLRADPKRYKEYKAEKRHRYATDKRYREYVIERARFWRTVHREEVVLRARVRREQNREEINRRRREKRATDPTVRAKERARRHTPEYRAYDAARHREYRKSDPEYREKSKTANREWRARKRAEKLAQQGKAS